MLYDYPFRTPTARTREESLCEAYAAGIVCTGAYLLPPARYPTRDAWCRARVTRTGRRPQACGPDLPAVLLSHCPLVRNPTRILRHPGSAQWCGTARTAGGHLRLRARTVVHGHPPHPPHHLVRRRALRGGAGRLPPPLAHPPAGAGRTGGDPAAPQPVTPPGTSCRAASAHRIRPVAPHPRS